MKISTASADRKALERAQARTPRTENSMAQDLCAFASVAFLLIAAVGWLPELAKVMH